MWRFKVRFHDVVGKHKNPCPPPHPPKKNAFMIIISRGLCVRTQPQLGIIERAAKREAGYSKARERGSRTGNGSREVKKRRRRVEE